MITTIIPAYGKPELLQSSIRSVQSQTYSDWELIVVDDNDPETEERKQTEKMLSDFASKDSRIHYVRHPRNLNGAAARNTGIRQAQGEYIAFLDSDDEYYPQRFQECLNALQNAPNEIAGVYTGCEFRRNGKTFRIVKNVEAGNFLVETLACTFMFCTGSNLFMKASAIRNLQGFDESFLRHQDYEFLVRYFEKYVLAAVPEVLVIKNNENINVPNVKKMVQIKKQYLQKYKTIITGLPSDKRDYIYRSQYIQIAEAAQRTAADNIALDYYNRAQALKRLTCKEQARRLAFYILSHGKGIR